MRIFLAGASGVIGIRLVPLLVEQGHVVAAMTRSPEKSEQLARLGGDPLVCDVFDADGLTDAMTHFRPEAVMHQVTDLPDRLDELSASSERNDRMRTEGTRNLVAAAQAAGAAAFVAQSIAWRPAGERGAVVDLHERQVLDIGGVVVRYGQFYGPGTYYEHEPPPHPRIRIDDAVQATPPLLLAPSGIVTLAEAS